MPELDRFRHLIGEETLDTCERHTRDQHSHIDHRHIIEGVAVRVEDENMFDIFKYKGFDFCHLEGIKKNDDTWVDLEEIS